MNYAQLNGGPEVRTLTGAPVDLGAVEPQESADRTRQLPTVRLVTEAEAAPARPMFAVPVDPADLEGTGLVGAALYRVFEIAVAVLVLVLLSPVLLTTALVIRLTSRGPALFFHPRAARSVPMRGRDLVGRSDIRPPQGEFEPDRLYWVPTTFMLAKFRTMYSDAAERFPQLDWWKHDVDPDECQEKHYKLENDPRVTWVGHFLRRTTIDELPNLWNVITGDIRLVGPRPEIVEVLRCYTPEQMLKFSVKPGLTCLAEVYGRNDLPVGEHVAWDLEYVRTRSFWLDMKILWRTVWAVLARRGAS
jgi:lipopolysaccharide/colanic/teichoic acid biosynthesis glycosyltransferase